MTKAEQYADEYRIWNAQQKPAPTEIVLKIDGAIGKRFKVTCEGYLEIGLFSHTSTYAVLSQTDVRQLLEWLKDTFEEPTKEQTLKPNECPWCSSKVVSVRFSSSNNPLKKSYVACCECLSSGPLMPSDEHAIREWNAIRKSKPKEPYAPNDQNF